MPEGAIYIGRPTRWGNRHFVGDADGCDSVEECVTAFEQDLLELGDARRAEYLAPLRGHDLACWCRLGRDVPCHVNALLRWANK